MRSGLPFCVWFGNLPFQVSDVVDGNDDELPVIRTGFIEEVEVRRPARQIVEVDLAVFPRCHFGQFQIEKPRASTRAQLLKNRSRASARRAGVKKWSSVKV